MESCSRRPRQRRMVCLGVELYPRLFAVTRFEKSIALGLGAVPRFAVGLFVGLRGHSFELADELLGHGRDTCSDIRSHRTFESIGVCQFDQNRGNGRWASARKVGNPHLEGFGRLRCKRIR